MKSQTCFITLDGTIHATVQKAKDHAEKRFGDYITRLAYELVGCNGKYTQFLDVLEKWAEDGTGENMCLLSKDRFLPGPPDDYDEN
jgi:hypothetical protein